jgi:hypothetical protein
MYIIVNMREREENALHLRVQAVRWRYLSSELHVIYKVFARIVL